MFGVIEEQLIEGLEAIRRKACVYGSDLDGSCDCKFGIGGEARPDSEQTGCPELRQAIKLLQGKYEEVVLITLQTEQSAARALREVADVLARAGVVV